MRQTADEFAVVLMIMLKQENKLRELGTYFVENPKVAAAFKNEVIDHWHPLSVERARKILRWLDDPGLVGSWQAKLVPHMQTDVLLRLQQQPAAWSDTAMARVTPRIHRDSMPAFTKWRNGFSVSRVVGPCT